MEEMEQVKAQVGFKGDLKAFFENLKTDPKLMPYKTPAEVLDGFRAIQAKMEPNLKTMFGREPSASCARAVGDASSARAPSISD